MSSNAVRKTTENEYAGRERILLVDDEKAIVLTYKLMLERFRYRITGMTDSREALDHLRAHPHDYDLVITDLSMHDVPGDKLATEVKAICPGIPVILISGNIDILEDKLQINDVSSVIPKPCRKENLAKGIRSVLDGE